MKIRTGFVSNSSSSSFVLIAKKAEYDEVRSECPDIIQHLTNSGNTHDAFGTKMVTLMGYESTEDWGYEIEDWDGELIDNDGNVVDTKGKDRYDLYDEVIGSEEQALNYIAKKMKEKGYDCIMDIEYC